MNSTRSVIVCALIFAVMCSPAAIAGSNPISYVSAQSAPSSQTIRAGGAEIEVDFASGRLDLPREAVLEWITAAADAVSAYYGGFPVGKARIQIVPVSGEGGILKGTTWGEPHAHTRMLLGEHTVRADLRQDWVLTHELVHMAFPDVADEHHWIEEGIATYVEPIARGQAGTLDPLLVWRYMERDMRQGEPGASDRGLDHTHTWGRTYWGGAMFCLIADVEIRERTNNRKGLQDALRGIVAAHGTIESQWSLRDAFAVADRATGTSVLSDLYNQWRDKPVYVDLDALWMRLGVTRTADGTTLDDAAPLALVRESILPEPR